MTGEGQIVGGDETYISGIEEARDECATSGLPVVRVGPVQDLVEQEQQRRRALADLDDRGQTFDLGVEMGQPFLQRVLHDI